MYWVIAYCVLVASGFFYCVIHDHGAERRGVEKHTTIPTHLTAKSNRSGR